MKPSIKFLKNVHEGEVCTTFRYSHRTGGKYGFRGGKVTYEKHLKAGLVNAAPAAGLGMRGVVTLTDAGVAALSEERAGQ